MRIAEIYRSRQGEGLLTGTDSIFVRVSGCNLRCWFCDTPFTSWEPEGDDLALEAILAAVDQLEAEHVVITGGEPMLYAELIPLCLALKQRGRHITIETAGTLHLPLRCDLMSISPKLASSTPSESQAGSWSARHARTRHQPDVIRKLLENHEYQLKFVVDLPSDVDDVEAWLSEFPEVSRDRVLLMPQGTSLEELATREAWLAPLCSDKQFRYCPRKHIEWYGFGRGT